MKSKLSNSLCGVSGEYFVAAELSRRGIVASLTQRNTMGIDILATNECGSESVNLQVKTSQGKGKRWMLNKKAEIASQKNLVYIFVSLQSTGDAPEYHIVPSRIVAEYITRTHQEWLNSPRKDGTSHADTSIRTFQDIELKYINRWDIIEDLLSD